MKILTAQEVKNRIETTPDIKLVMTLRPDAYYKSHIPGSVNIWDINTAKKVFSKNTEIIVYCSDLSCMSSYYAYQQLEKAGFKHIWRFAGGLVEWHKAGYELTNTIN